MAERAKEMIQKSLRPALFTVQCLRKAHKLIESALQFASHGNMVTKTAATDKRAFPGARPQQSDRLGRRLTASASARMAATYERIN